MFGTLARLARSKTVWGVVIGAGGWLINQPHIQLPQVIDAISAVVTAAGVHDAIKNAGHGTGK